MDKNNLQFAIRSSQLTAALIVLLLLCSNAFGAMEIIVEADSGKVYDYVYSLPAAVEKAINEGSRVNTVARSYSPAQADMSINGGTFDQAAVVIDGIKTNDPQTGHYSLDLGLPSIAIGEASVVSGGNSSSGSGGFTGALFMKTLDAETDRILVEGAYGTFDTRKYAALFSRSIGDFGVLAAAEKKSSAGYHYDTEYDINNAYAKISFLKKYLVSAGYGENTYGAYDFYTPGLKYPSQEYTITRFANFTGEFTDMVKVSLYARDHYDKYILDETKPWYYANKHKTLFYGVLHEFTAPKLTDDLTLKFFLELRKEEIQSSSLHNNYRFKKSFQLTVFAKLLGLTEANINAGVENLEPYKNYEFLASGYFNTKITEWLKHNLSLSNVIRYPTFTDLYYYSAANRGNPSLNPERAFEVSTGLTAAQDKSKLSLSGFYRKGTELIDWGKSSAAQTYWQVMNIGKVDTYGFSATGSQKLGEFDLKADYALLDSHPSESYISKYGLNYLKNKLTASCAYSSNIISARADYVYKKYINRDEVYNGIDLSISKKFFDVTEITLKAENLLNLYFEEIKGIPARGRYVEVQVKLGF